MRYLKIASTAVLMSLLLVGLTSISALAQDPRYYPPQELEHLVSRVALYPDPLLAQVLAAASFSDQIPDAARWADQHRNVTGDALSRAISDDNLPWDPSVQALLPFPSVLGMMASDMPWTENLGNAFLAQHNDVMDAVQRMRHHAYEYGYLRTNPQIVVTGGPYIEIRPVRAGVSRRAGLRSGSGLCPAPARFRGRRRHSLRIRRHCRRGLSPLGMGIEPHRLG